MVVLALEAQFASTALAQRPISYPCGGSRQLAVRRKPAGSRRPR